MGMLDFLNEPVAKLRGGWRQRAQRQQVMGRIRSKVAETELGKWCDGRTTTPLLVQLCRDAIDDGLNQPILHRLSCRKRFQVRKTQVRLRDLMKVLDNKNITDFIVELGPGPITHMIKPSAVMNYVLQNFPLKFQKIFGANKTSLSKFWDGLLSSPIGREMLVVNPMLAAQTPETLSRCIPILIHEDAGPYAKSKSMNIINFSSLLGKGAEHSTKILVATHKSDKQTKAANFTTFWDAMVQDFDELALHDKFVGADGQSWRAVLIFGKGDGNANGHLGLARLVSCCGCVPALPSKSRPTSIHRQPPKCKLAPNWNSKDAK